MILKKNQLKKDNILILGSTSFLSSYLQKELNSKAKLFLYSRKSPIFDLYNFRSCYKFLTVNKINFIINCIADTSLESNEKSLERSIQNNTLPIIQIIKAAKKSLYLKGFIHISTDQVYSGKKTYFNETDNPNPLNIYSKVKLLTENIVKDYNRALIIRTNFFGYNKNFKNNIVSWFLNNIKNSKKTFGYTNIFFNPVHASTLCEFISSILNNYKFGIFNLSCSDRISKYFFLKKIKILLSNKNNFLLHKSKYFNNDIVRPFNMSLDSSKIAKEFNFVIPKINDEIKKIQKELVK